MVAILLMFCVVVAVCMIAVIRLSCTADSVLLISAVVVMVLEAVAATGLSISWAKVRKEEK